MQHSISRFVAVVGAVGALATAASPADAMTIRVGEPTLIGRVVLSVPVTVSCTPFDTSYTLVSTSVSVSVQQAAGQDIAFGSGYLTGGLYGMGGGPTPLFTCDDVEHSVTVPVSANTAGPPFHGGHVAATASAWASAGQPCYPGATNCFQILAYQSATAGPVEVHL